jgi:hypothetical protein
MKTGTSSAPVRQYREPVRQPATGPYKAISAASAADTTPAAVRQSSTGRIRTPARRSPPLGDGGGFLSGPKGKRCVGCESLDLVGAAEGCHGHRPQPPSETALLGACDAEVRRGAASWEAP